eukprot:CAMPEP_0115571076 /NCGR_PEP_ID=MMETSP0271-20121206/106026_1 /TAXON_ID=71861 /ORGANISM="Scrippsiella trochoidea, Strain CCMP3099" /LENGTH=95 /DNA_ID=CAMNT_0003005629 /DNA_START=888 /DNA_END=1171 /DNA_ORIENTATION=+
MSSLKSSPTISLTSGPTHIGMLSRLIWYLPPTSQLSSSDPLPEPRLLERRLKGDCAMDAAAAAPWTMPEREDRMPRGERPLPPSAVAISAEFSPS